MATIPRKRRRTKLQERLTPCECCGHAVSQRHHVLPVARFGEYGGDTIHLCANCHEAYHIFERGMIDFTAKRHGTDAACLMNAIYHTWGGGTDSRVRFLFGLLDQTRLQMEAAVHTIALDSLDDQEIRKRLRRLLEMPETPGVRRGDTVRLSNGLVAQVVRIRGMSVETTKGTYSFLDVERIAGD